MDTSAAVTACAAAHQRLCTTASRIDDATARRPSLLRGWTVGHVLTHLARNADGHVQRLEGALRGAEIPRYPGGTEQRDADVEDGAGRPAAELASDFADSASRLEETWQRCERAGWPYAQLLAGDRWPTTASPVRRLREVEVHHADLGPGYGPADWPDDYVDWELAVGLARLPERFAGPGDTRRFLAWLIGRAARPDDVELLPWD